MPDPLIIVAIVAGLCLFNAARILGGGGGTFAGMLLGAVGTFLWLGHLTDGGLTAPRALLCIPGALAGALLLALPIGVFRDNYDKAERWFGYLFLAGLGLLLAHEGYRTFEVRVAQRVERLGAAMEAELASPGDATKQAVEDRYEELGLVTRRHMSNVALRPELRDLVNWAIRTKQDLDMSRRMGKLRLPHQSYLMGIGPDPELQRLEKEMKALTSESSAFLSMAIRIRGKQAAAEARDARFLPDSLAEWME